MRQSIISLLICIAALGFAAAQTRKRPAKTRAPRGSATKYSAFLHSSDKHKELACNSCHKIPTTWTAGRDFPDAADFPDHNACVRCHRQQFFTRRSFAGSGPAICTVCHVRSAPREDGRFVFGKPNNANQSTKARDERQFTIEFPHDKHQNVIASLRPPAEVRFVRALFTDDPPKTDYNNCSICHVKNDKLAPAFADAFLPPSGTFKTKPRTHDACFQCHWKNLKPAADDCGGCHKLAATFVAMDWPKRTSLKFSHEGGKENHFAECTTCHINITRASTLRGLTPDVPINACVACHRDSKSITYGPKMVTIETEIAEFKKTGNCTYCHTSDVGKKTAPPSHSASVQ